MLSFMRQTIRAVARSGTQPGGRPCAVRRPECEVLEGRTLPSLTGAQLFANSLGSHAHATIASAPTGRSVVAWVKEISPLDHDIKAQVFDASGHKVGGVLSVASGRENTYQPAVAVNAKGAFVVAWTLDFSRTDTDIHATLFRPDRTRVANDFEVATTYKREFGANVGMDVQGDFVVSYTVQYSSSDTDVRAALFGPGAHPIRTINVANSTRPEATSRVFVSSGGAFTVSYSSSGTRVVEHFTRSGQPTNSPPPTRTPPPPPTRTPPPTPPPHPQPHSTLPLRGRIVGGFLQVAAGADRGKHYDLAGIGSLTGLGEVMLTGELRSTGFVQSGHATGALTLRNSHGMVRLNLQGPTQRAFAPLPRRFHFTVAGGSGSYSHLHEAGILNVHLSRLSHTFTIDIIP